MRPELTQIEGWEDRLAECGPAGNPTSLADLNDDLQNFLLENKETIQSLIDQAIDDKKA